MKIYSKSNFVAGLLGLGTLILFAFDAHDTKGWQWALAAFIVVRCLYTALNESASKQSQRYQSNYEKTAIAMYGKYHAIKTNLPLILVIAVFAVTLVLRFLFDIWLPVWIYVVFILALSVAAIYSIGIQQNIKNYMDEHLPETTEE